MRYVGSKRRFAKQLVAIISALKGDRFLYLEPFLGGGNSFCAVAPMFRHYAAGDTHVDLMLMWQAIANGWTPPDEVSEEQYEELKNAAPSALRGFTGFAGSYAAKWFGGYARGWDIYGEQLNYIAGGMRSVLGQKEIMKCAKLRCCSYDAWKVDKRVVAYCDPPYATTLRYKKTDIEYEHFWQTMREWSATEALVLVSEQTAPDDFIAIASFRRSTLNGRQLKTDSTDSVESIYLHQSSAAECLKLATSAIIANSQAQKR